MATGRNRKRLESIEQALTPRELLDCSIEERAKFASRAEYAAWLAEDLNRAPISTMLQQITSSGADGSPPARKNLLSELQRKQIKELMFLSHLLRILDRQVHDVLAREESHLAAIALSRLAANQSVTFGLAMLQVGEPLALVVHPGDEDLAAAVALTAETTDEFCRRGSTFGGPEIGTSMKFIQANLCTLLISVRATMAAIERLSARFFHGLKIAFKSDADALDTLGQRAAGLVSDHNKLVGLLEAIPFQLGVLDGVDRIDQERIEQAVQEEASNLARDLVALAHAETLFLFEEQESDAERALGLLRPMLKLEIEACA